VHGLLLAGRDSYIQNTNSFILQKNVCLFRLGSHEVRRFHSINSL
jgi:hypothetical protein